MYFQSIYYCNFDLFYHCQICWRLSFRSKQNSFPCVPKLLPLPQKTHNASIFFINDNAMFLPWVVFIEINVKICIFPKPHCKQKRTTHQIYGLNFANMRKLRCIFKITINNNHWQDVDRAVSAAFKIKASSVYSAVSIKSMLVLWESCCCFLRCSPFWNASSYQICGTSVGHRGGFSLNPA